MRTMCGRGGSDLAPWSSLPLSPGPSTSMFSWSQQDRQMSADYLSTYDAMPWCALGGSLEMSPWREICIPSSPSPTTCCLCLVALRDFDKKASTNIKICETGLVNHYRVARTHRLLEKLVADAPLLKQFGEAAPDSRLSR